MQMIIRPMNKSRKFTAILLDNSAMLATILLEDACHFDSINIYNLLCG